MAIVYLMQIIVPCRVIRFYPRLTLVKDSRF